MLGTSVFAADSSPVSLPVEYTIVKVVQETPASSPWSLSGNYSFKSTDWTVVVTNTFDTPWTDLFGKKGVNIELFSMVGGSDIKAIAGGGIRLVVPIHDRISLNAGFTVFKSVNSFDSFFSNLNGFGAGFTAGVSYTTKF